MPRYRVTDMDLDEVSVVDRPANQHGLIVLAKRDSGDDMSELYDEDNNVVDLDDAEIGEVLYDESGQAFEVGYEEDEPVEVGKSAFGVYGDVEKANPFTRKGRARNREHRSENRELASTLSGREKAGAAFGGVAYTAAKAPKGSRMAAAKTAVRQANTPGGNALSGHAKARDEHFSKSAFFDSDSDSIASIRDDLSKALDDEARDEIVSKAFGAYEARIEELEKAAGESARIAKAEQDLRLEREYIAKADEYNLPVAGKELGPVLKRAAESLSYEDCAVLHKALTTSGELFHELGVHGEGDMFDPFAEIEAHANAELQKSDTHISKAQATSDYFQANPEAYDQMRAQRG